MSSLAELKTVIKKWETTFMERNKNKPNKEDLKGAPDEIKDAYRNYWKMKNVSPSEKKTEPTDDVWSAKLNKSAEVISKRDTKLVVKKITDKLKKLSDTSSPKSFRPLKSLTKSGSKSNVAEVPRDINVSDHLVNNNDDHPNLDTDNEPLFSSKMFKIRKEQSHAPVSFKIINALTPLSDTLLQSQSHFCNDINPDWLTRCSSEIVDNSNQNNHFESKKDHESSNILESDSALQDEKCSISVNNRIEQLVNVENKVKKRPRSTSPVHTNDCDLNDVDQLDTDFTPKVKKPKNDPADGTTVQKARDKSAHLKKKISSGTLNENFVRLDIKKKVYARGHRRINVRKLKYMKWKKLKKNNESGEIKSVSSTACFKCGEIGHWARNCHTVKEKLLPNCEETFDFSLPTLEEAEALCKTASSSVNPSSVENMSGVDCGIRTESSLDCSNKSSAVEMEKNRILPFFDSDSETSEYDEIFLGALKVFGHKKFRPRQKEIIMRILSQKSTLAILPTGSGKSLCYQLPAYLYSQKAPCISLVVSPLVSLMEDQITGLPSSVRAVCLHSGMSDAQKKVALDAISAGNVQIVLVSPEAVISGKGFGVPLPLIAFACIDEAHCLSEWSHNFRPSYLQIYKVLSHKYQVRCILGLTATATKSTALDIMRHLNLSKSENSTIGETNVPDNIHISVSLDKDKDDALLKLLKSDRFHTCRSIIVYCIRREEADRLATVIRTCLQDEIATSEPQQQKKDRRRKQQHLVWSAEAYHAGLTSAKRRSVQKQFMTGKLRVVVATVAFGMGLDKSDVHAVIHYNMPKSFESYVQEIGRAGRDGSDAQCHLFLGKENKDLCELRRHIYSNGVDRHTLHKLMKKIFVPCKCRRLNQLTVEMENDTCPISENCPKHEVCFPIEKTVQDLDLKEESIATLLCYLELHPEKWIEQLTPAYSRCSIRCYGGLKQMSSLLKKCPAIAVSMAIDKRNGVEWKASANYEFQVVDVAAQMGWESSRLKKELKGLEWHGGKKTGVLVEFSDLAFHVKAPGDLTDDQWDSILDFLYSRNINQEEIALQKLNQLHSMFQKYSCSHYWKCCDEIDSEKSEAIKLEIKNYFNQCDELIREDAVPALNDEVTLNDVRQYIREIINTNHEQDFTARAIARIFHGIDSPRYPAKIWGRVYRFWRCHLGVDFHVVMKLAKEELQRFRLHAN